MPWSCFRPKTQVLSSLDPVVTVSEEKVVSAEVAAVVQEKVSEPVSRCVPVASGRCVPVACSSSSRCCVPAASGCCVPVSCASCKKSPEVPLVVRSTPETEEGEIGQGVKVEEKPVSPDALPAQVPSTQEPPVKPQ